jgi:hypothetical protein
MLMTAADYRESPRAYKPRVFVNENSIESVADEPLLAPGIAGVAVTYDFAHRKEHIPIMTARQGTSGKTLSDFSKTRTCRTGYVSSSAIPVWSTTRRQMARFIPKESQSYRMEIGPESSTSGLAVIACHHGLI